MTEVSHGHCCGHIDRGQAPEQDDGEQGAHAEGYQGVADVAESADEHDDGEQEEDAQQPHGDRPKKLFNTHSPEKYDIMRLALRRKP